jgi:hypothetical protein
VELVDDTDRFDHERKEPIMRRLVAIAALAVGIAASVASTDSSSESASDDSGASASAQLACEHFRNVAGDIGDGVLTDAEIRTKLQEVDGSASVADEPAVAAASRAMLAAATTGTPGEFIDAAGQMDAACSDVGL